MKQDMNNLLIRMCTLLLLIFVSMRVSAKVDVELNKEYKGGKVEVKSQEDNPDGSTLVTITVTPGQGFTITHSDKNKGIIVVAVRPTGGQSGTRAPEIAGDLTVTGPTGTVSYPNSVDYQFTVPAGLNAWVQDIKFQDSGRKGDGDEEEELGYYSGTYYIASYAKVPNSNPARYVYDPANPNNQDNFYLCPSDGWIYYKKDNNWTADKPSSDGPFLTTFKCRTNDYDAQGGMNNAKWVVTKHGDYYTFYHTGTSKYLVLSGQINGCGVDRMRVHLEEITSPETPGDNALFTIAPENQGLYIAPKTISGDRLTVNGGNQNSLIGESGKPGGPSGYANTAGIVGIYRGTGTDDNRYFYLEDYITRPTISYSSGNNVTITYPTSATIYYTTDGSNPTNPGNANRSFFTGTSQTVPFTNVAVVKAAAYIDGEYSNIATYVYVHTGSENPYLLQSMDNTNFYMLAGDASGANTTVNTSSLPQAGMSWWFEDANDVVEGAKYYYVHNTSAEGYLRRDNNSFNITTTGGTSDDYKFAVIPYLNENGTLAGFYLYNKGKKQYVYKGNNNNVVGNGSDGAVNLTSNADQDLARWNLILEANKSFPSPVTMSDNSSVTYYTFASSNTPAQLITPPTGTSTYVKTSSGENDNQKWYFKDAGSDGWASYYYILNAVTGEAIFFGQEAASTIISDALQTGTLPETPTDNYKFALAHTVTDGEYYIVPKPLAQYTKTKFDAVWYVNTTTSLQTQSNRASNQIKWQISEEVDYVAPPYITYDVATNTATISSTYPGATIYYTTDGSEATTSSTNFVAPVAPSSTASTSFVLTADITTIRAIVSKGGAGTSSESTYSVALQLTVSDAAADQRPYLIQSQNNAWNTSDFHFYMIPGDDVGEEGSKITKVNTTSLFRPSMEWHFLNAGIEDGVQYYYIVNNANSKYLCYDATNNVYMETFSSDNKFKFKIVESPTAGTYNIYPYGQNIIINKNTHNANSGAINTATYSANNANSGNTRWKFVLPSALDKTAPFTASDASTTYYKINSVGSNDYYIVPPSDDNTNATTSNSSDDNVVKTGAWYFEEAQAADASDWLTYYHIRNAETGKYLYFDKDANNAGACLEMKEAIESGNEDRYMFTWARTATENTYYIVPKLLKDASLNQISSLWRDNNTLKSNLTRDAGNYAWTFTTETFNCEEPVITYSTEQNGFVISTTTPGAKIYYTTDNNSNTLEWTEYTEGTAIPTPTTPTTIKAIAARSSDQSDKSTVAECPVTEVETPEFDYSAGNSVSITCATEGAVIYYVINGTIDSTNPTNGTTLYERPLTDEDGIVGNTISAIAVKPGSISSPVVISDVIVLRCATPVIKRGSDGVSFTIECSFPTSGVTIKYTTATGSGTPADPSSQGVNYEHAVPCSFPITIRAIAIAEGYENSEEATRTIDEGLAEEDGVYLISSDDDFETFVEMVLNNENGEAAAHYKLMTDVSASGVDPITNFTGTFDGGMNTISNLGHALFNTVNGGVVKNVILDNVSISGGTNVGAICNEAIGASRIYNCGILATNSSIKKDEDGYDHISSISSTISGSGNVGSIVGLLDGSSRVINCFSYADVSGGSYVGGIVGYNNVATTASNLQTMVMNCMFYGEVSGGSIAPIYNGEIITNDGDDNGVNNFNYFWEGASYVRHINVYNCALAAETRFLQRFEFYRHLLNSNRELAAWWATGSADNKNEMMKWVMEPTQIRTATPYPILKTPDKYASVVNFTPSETAYDEANRNTGRKLTSEGDGGVLHVTIQMGAGGAQYPAPSGAGFKTGVASNFDLTITDKDFEHFNFNYGKVQLPYYNDYCVGNYTENRVVTGWKIVSMNKSAGSFSTGSDASATDNADATITLTTPYNFADRKNTAKDIYSDTNKRVFSQGAYFDVPEGVTSITIQPYWGKAVYLADAYWDVTYKNGTGNDKNAAGYIDDAMTTELNVSNVGGGQHYENGKKYNLATHSLDETNGQIVYTSMGNAIASSGSALFAGGDANSHTVYDYAVVLVGNYHHNGSIEASKSKPYTVTSVDLDGDNEPDYSFILRFNGRTAFHPARYDFLNMIGLGMAQKTTGGKGSYNLGIMQPKAWFEVTNTALLRVTQFEYDRDDRSESPHILQGGVIEQWVCGQNNGVSNNTIYFHVGGNVWFKEFQLGTHIDKTWSAKHPPISVTGGDFSEFYLTGLYRGEITSFDDNAECYINGGRFGVLVGAGQEGLGNATNHTNGNITWQINNADITEFYGGGLNQPIQGKITTVISNSHVVQFCGGPKFGDMNTGKKVNTIATNCTFGTYFGAGYGGNAYSREAPSNVNNIVGDYTGWNTWVNQKYTQAYSNNYKGVSTEFDYQYLPMSNNTQNVARIFIDYVRFSLATTHEVTSLLTDCHITGNFYGGGNLGKVEGSVTSTLTNCTVNGSVFGAGYSASTPTVNVMNTGGGFTTPPFYDENLGAYLEPVFPSTVQYTWDHKDNVNSTANAIDKTNHILYTTENLTTLGTVTGNVYLTIDGTTTVAESVYGGGEESAVKKKEGVTNSGNIIVNLQGNAQVYGNVFGGGNEGLVEGSATVNIMVPETNNNNNNNGGDNNGGDNNGGGNNNGG